MKLNFIVLTLLLVMKCFNGQTIISSANCPTSCSCSVIFSTLTITGCTQQFSTLSFNTVADPQLLTVTSIVAQNNLIQSVPNLCSYSSVLTSLDLSNNQITALTNNIACLTKLLTLKLNNNLIATLSNNSFSSILGLQFLYLQYNKITSIPQGLFTPALSNLVLIDLSYNLLTTMEMWPLYLSKIVNINLKYNSIQGFTNTFGWYLYQNYPSLPSTSTIDLQYNSINSLSDSTIQQYGVCSFSDYGRFINNYFNLFWLDNNPINCNCANSQRLVTDSITILNSVPSLLNSNLYKSFCKTPSNYFGKHIINFDTCTTSISYPYCINGSSTTTTTTTTTTVITTTTIASIISITPDAGALSETMTTLAPGTIAGIAIGSIVVLLLILFIIIFICLTEIKACCFFHCSSCYVCFSDCCSNKRTKAFANDMSEKFYDIFVSYNKKDENSEKWIKDRLMPKIQVHDPKIKYFLQYGTENTEQACYSTLIEEKFKNTNHLVLVLSDKFLDEEWNDIKFRSHIRHLIQIRKIDITCVQMIDVTDEEVEEFVRNEIQSTNLRSFEIDECCFWTKLKYFILRYRNPHHEGKYVKITKADDEAELVSKKRRKPVGKEPSVRTPVENINIKPDSEVQFPDYNIKGPIVHKLYDINEANTRYDRVKEIGKRQKKVARDLERINDEVANNPKREHPDIKFPVHDEADDVERHKKHKHKKHKHHKKSKHVDNYTEAKYVDSADGQQSLASTSNIKPEYTAPYVVRQGAPLDDQNNMILKPKVRKSHHREEDD